MERGALQEVLEAIVARLVPLRPQKILLFGSYAYGTPDEESDIDILLIKSLPKSELRAYQLEAMKRLRDIKRDYDVAIDVLVMPPKVLLEREDYFFRVELGEKARCLYEAAA
ncbi:nucleotidyltransferase domain-containing protein [Hydrogenimonas sp.]